MIAIIDRINVIQLKIITGYNLDCKTETNTEAHYYCQRDVEPENCNESNAVELNNHKCQKS